MVPLGVDGSSGEGFLSPDDEPVPGLLHVAPQGVEGLPGGDQAVGLLDPQAGGPHDAGLPGGNRRHGGQDGNQVGDVPGVDDGGFQLAGLCGVVTAGVGDPAPHAGEDVADPFIPLEGVRVHAGDGDAVPTQNPHAQPGGGVGPVPLHRCGLGAVIAQARNFPTVPLVLGDHAEVGQGPEGQVNVALGLHLTGDGEGAGFVQGGQGEEQARDELGGHISGQGEGPGGELAGEVHLVVLRARGDGAAVVPQLGGQWLHGPLGQTPRHVEGPGSPQGADHRKQEAEGGAALAAVQGAWAGDVGPVNGGHVVPPSPAGDDRSQAGETPDGSGDVLGLLIAADEGLCIRQGGADQQAVGRRLGGNGADGAGQRARLDGAGHRFSPFSIQWYRSDTATFCSSLLPQAVGTTREMVLPVRFLSDRVFS